MAEIEKQVVERFSLNPSFKIKINFGCAGWVQIEDKIRYVFKINDCNEEFACNIKIGLKILKEIKENVIDNKNINIKKVEIIDIEMDKKGNIIIDTSNLPRYNWLQKMWRKIWKK